VVKKNVEFSQQACVATPSAKGDAMA